MVHILLSGVGGSSNWFPLVLPLAGIVVIAYLIQVTVRFVKKRKLHHEDNLVNDLSAPSDSTRQDQI